jgi:hypothetical protein
VKILTFTRLLISKNDFDPPSLGCLAVPGVLAYPVLIQRHDYKFESFAALEAPIGHRCRRKTAECRKSALGPENMELGPANTDWLHYWLSTSSVERIRFTSLLGLQYSMLIYLVVFQFDALDVTRTVV